MVDKKNFKVFISSTYLDNKKRRELVQKAILDAGMFPVGMERFTARRNPTVDYCQKMATEADVLVGIIAHRYGWIPKKRAISITEIEYKAAKGAEKDRLMFQINPSLPVHMDKDFDQGPDKFKKQEKLEKFKTKFSKDQMPTFFTEEELGQKVLKALIDWRKEKEAEISPKQADIQIEKRKKTDPKIKSPLERYKKKIEALYGKIRFFGFSKHFEVSIDLKDLYIPLTAIMNLRGVSDKQYLSSEDAYHCMGKCGGDPKDISLPYAFTLERLKTKRGIVILGDPGSGKTTHLIRVLLSCIRRGTNSIGLPDEMTPILLPLRYLGDDVSSISEFVKDQLTKPPFKLPLKGFVEPILDRDNLLFLLDGMDEVADIKKREKVKTWIRDALIEFPDSKFVVTSRFSGYEPNVRLGGDFLEMHITPFSKDQASDFIRKWYKVVETETNDESETAQEKATEKSEHLISILEKPDFRSRRILEMTRNPLLLTNLCIVHWYRGTLPRDRAYLYEECINILLERWQEYKQLNLDVAAKQGRLVLQPAAYWMHQKEKRTRATAEELSPIIDPVLKKVGWTKGKSDKFLKTIRDESGLLVGWDQEHYGFMHLGFQEYLAAKEIKSQAFYNPEVIGELAAHFGDSWWEEVILLLLSFEDPPLFKAFMKEAVKQKGFGEDSKFLNLCIEESAEIDLEPFVELLKQAPGKTKDLWTRQLQALRIINQIDPNTLAYMSTVISKHPFLEISGWLKSQKKETRKQKDRKIVYTESGGVKLVRILGGSFMMGRSEDDAVNEWDDELPRHKVKIKDFFLGRYPITNEEYGRFFKENPKAKEPKYWADRKRNQPKQPIVGVSWHDASAFAEWAGCRLPSEAEWEFACRAGTTGSRYGDLGKVAWYNENSDGRTQPVGQKAPNAFCLYDTLGNVWEWNEDTWHESYEEAPDDGSAWVTKKQSDRRVVRGGSWTDVTVIVRASIRNRYAPDGRSDSIGFRVCRDC